MEISTTPCDECAALIPDEFRALVNNYHRLSCSLHPDNSVTPDAPTPDPPTVEGSTRPSLWCPICGVAYQSRVITTNPGVSRAAIMLCPSGHCWRCEYVPIDRQANGTCNYRWASIKVLV